MTWDVDPVAIHGGLISLRWYGIFLVVALLGAFFHMQWLIVQAGKGHYFDRIAVSGFAGGMVGARIGHFLFYETSTLMAHPMVLVDFDRAGLSSHGAIVGLIAAFWLCCRGKPDLPLTLVLARGAVTYVGTCVILRIGNFFNSELIGTPTDVPWAVTFVAVDGLARHPVQLYEAMACIGAYTLLMVLFRRQLSDDRLFSWAIILMSVQRFLLEYFKADQSPIEAGLPLNIGQIATLPMLAVGCALLIYTYRGHLRPAPVPVSREETSNT